MHWKRRCFSIMVMIIFIVLKFSNYDKIKSKNTNFIRLRSKKENTLNNTFKKEFAYVFFATNFNYWCSSLINSKRIIELDKSNNYDIVILIADTLNIQKRKFFNIKVKRIKFWTYSTDNYYQDVFLKFAVFNQTQYSKIIYIDSDAIVMKNLNHLFYLPQKELAIPPMYWNYPNKGKKYPVTSALMVIKPSSITFKKLMNLSIEFSNKKLNGRAMFDMDIINLVFLNDSNLVVLDPLYLCLNSHWVHKDISNEKNPNLWSMFKTKDLILLSNECFVIHFSAIGKPWTFKSNFIVKNYKNSHPKLAELFGLWNKYSKRICF